MTVAFQKHREDTLMTLVHSDLPDTDEAKGHERGWNYFLDILREQFGSGSRKEYRGKRLIRSGNEIAQRRQGNRNLPILRGSTSASAAYDSSDGRKRRSPGANQDLSERSHGELTQRRCKEDTRERARQWPEDVLRNRGNRRFAFGFAGLKSFPALAQNHSIITVDLQGNGRTADIPDRPVSIEQYAKDVVDLLKYLGISKADFFGESYEGGNDGPGGDTTKVVLVVGPKTIAANRTPGLSPSSRPADADIDGAIVAAGSPGAGGRPGPGGNGGPGGEGISCHFPASDAHVGPNGPQGPPVRRVPPAISTLNRSQGGHCRGPSSGMLSPHFPSRGCREECG